MTVQPPEPTTLSPADDVAEDLRHGLRSYLARAEDHDRVAKEYDENAQRNRDWAAEARAKAAALSEILTRLDIPHDPPYQVAEG